VPVSFFLVDESGAMSDPFQVWVDFTKGAITKGLVRGGKARD
jgi:hypothetical protein